MSPQEMFSSRNTTTKFLIAQNTVLRSDLDGSDFRLETRFSRFCMTECVNRLPHALIGNDGIFRFEFAFEPGRRPANLIYEGEVSFFCIGVFKLFVTAWWR